MPYKIRIGGLSAVPTTSVESLFSPFGKILSIEPDKEPSADQPEVGGYQAADGRDRDVRG